MGKNELRITAVVPAYNAEKYLAEALQSVLDQSHPVSEIILVDDGSTDKSAQVVGKFGDLVHYIYQDNQGQGAALNAGIVQSTGDYMAPIDADDIWHKEKISKQLAELNADPNLDIVFGHLNNLLAPNWMKQRSKE